MKYEIKYLIINKLIHIYYIKYTIEIFDNQQINSIFYEFFTKSY
jgi:hypothetical protein